MFQVGRYDPQKGRKDQQKRKAKRKRKKSDEESSTNSQKKRSSPPNEPNAAIRELNEEEFDDLAIADGLIEDDDNTVPAPVEIPNTKEIAAAIEMADLPICDAAEKWGLAPFLVENLRREGFEKFFPIQALVIPDSITSAMNSHIQARDLCVTAPTGSGKTLSYVLPVLNALASRVVRRLRALVVLPSRDLARQVHQVFETYTLGSSLKVGLAIGQSDFREEQMLLAVDQGGGSSDLVNLQLRIDPLDVSRLLEASTRSNMPGTSAVDILVCTPGRLVDHLDNTPGFTLEHLQFLVVDEADRLLGQSYHNWVDRVIESANSGSVSRWKKISRDDFVLKEPPVSTDGSTMLVTPTTWRRGGIAGDDSNFNTNDGFSSIAATICQPVQLRKFLVSATLTRDPQKLAALKLINPKHCDVHQMFSNGAESRKFTVPVNLCEYTAECSARQKPVVLIALILDHLRGADIKNTAVAVFTSSVDTTHRLARLLQIFWDTCNLGNANSVVEYSSALNQNERSELICRLKDTPLSVVVCSDGMSRGLDIGSVGTVINYDVPVLAKTYVHRCGRTARAGKEGSAISILKNGQTNQFQKMRALIHEPERVESMSIKKHLVQDVVQNYKECVSLLRRVLEAEEKDELSTKAKIPNDF